MRKAIELLGGFSICRPWDQAWEVRVDPVDLWLGTVERVGDRKWRVSYAHRDLVPPATGSNDYGSIEYPTRRAAVTVLTDAFFSRYES